MIEPSQRIFTSLQTGLWLGATYLYLLILFALNLAALPVFLAASIKPPFLLMGIYFVLLMRADLLPLVALFMIGVVFDLLTGDLVGLNALVFLLLALTVHAQKRFLSGQGWLVIWAGFWAASLAAAVFTYLLHAVMALSWPSLLPFVTNVILGGLLYPLVVLPLHIFLRRLHIAKMHHP